MRIAALDRAPEWYQGHQATSQSKIGLRAETVGDNSGLLVP